MVMSFEDITGIKPTTSAIRGTSLPEERSFIEDIMESFKRGGESVKSHIAIHEALEADDQLQIQSALYANKQLEKGHALDPIDGNILEDLVTKSSQTIGQMVENLKHAGFGATVGGMAGAGIGAAAGLVIPTVGEEPFTVGGGAMTGAKIGAKLGGTEASALMSFREGRGGIYAEMIDQGVPHDIAKKYSNYGAVPYALIEMFQVAEAVPGAKGMITQLKKKATKKFASTLLKKYATKLGTEVGEEILQEIVQIGAEDLAKVAADMGLEVDEDYFKDRADRLWSTAVESAKAFALVPIPASSIEASIAVESSRMEAQMMEAKLQAAKSEPFDIRPEDLDSPVAKLNAALNNSINTISIQEDIRKKEKGERIGEAETAMQEASAENWIQAMKSKLRGKYTALNIEPISNQINPGTHLELMEDIRTSPNRKILNPLEAMKLGEAYQKLYTEGKPLTPYEVKQAKKLWGETIARQLDTLSEAIKGEGVITDILALPKTIAASGDLSAILRQTALLIGSPKQWLKSAVANWKALTHDEKTLSLLEKEMLTSEIGQKAIESGMVWNKWKQGTGYRSGTERFASKTAKKVPFVQRSSRAYGFGLNTARLAMFEKIAKQWEGRKNFDPTAKDWKSLAHVVNIMTGEAPAKTLHKHASTLNALFFAPRLLEARIRSFTDIVNPNISVAARKVLAWQMIKFVGINLSVLAMLSNVNGVEVERDPRSANFGKIKIGDMRIDFWGGFLPLARTLTRLITGKTKTQSGRVIPTEQLDVITSFLQSKLGPVPSAALDFARKQNFIGEEIKFDPDGVSKEFYEKFTPFFLQDILDAIQYQGLKGGMIAAPLAFHGAGVSTYPQSPSARVMSKKNEISREIMGVNWDELGPDLQKYMREVFPEIGMQEMKAQYEYSKRATKATFLREQKLTTKRIRKKLFPSVKRELDRLSMVQGLGISRVIGDWRMPDNSYREYEKEAVKGYNQILSKAISSKKWNRIPDHIKIEIISEILMDVKAGVRENIIAEANIKDFKRLRGMI